MTASVKKEDIGQFGEKLAAKYLEDNNYQVIDSNFSNRTGYRSGEIDIIARDPDTKEVVFVEVKTKLLEDKYQPLPEAAITRSKYHKLRRIISRYLSEKRLGGCDYRLDAISIEIDSENKRAGIRHLRHIYY